jgi:hypothetical protein
LPVSEIENIIVLPSVNRAIAESEEYVGADLEGRLIGLQAAIFGTLSSAKAIDTVVTRYCRRRIDRLLKKIDLGGASDVAGITAEYWRLTTALNIGDIAEKAAARSQEALREQDLPKLPGDHDNKGLMALAASRLMSSKLEDFESWLTRVLKNGTVPALSATIRNSVSTIHPE